MSTEPSSEKSARRGISNRIVVVAVVAASILFAIGLWSRVKDDQSGQSTRPSSSAAQEQSCVIQPEVLDGLTGAPLGGATIIIPETDTRHTTDETGKTELIELPAAVSGGPMPKSWVEVSILVYKDGYVPYALFNAQALPNQTRQGPRIYLFPTNSLPDDQPFSVTEGPPRSWVNALIERYNP